jgi:hypothetical protein
MWRPRNILFKVVTKQISAHQPKILSSAALSQPVLECSMTLGEWPNTAAPKPPDSGATDAVQKQAPEWRAVAEPSQSAKQTVQNIHTAQVLQAHSLPGAPVRKGPPT